MYCVCQCASKKEKRYKVLDVLSMLGKAEYISVHSPGRAELCIFTELSVDMYVYLCAGSRI